MVYEVKKIDNGAWSIELVKNIRLREVSRSILSNINGYADYNFSNFFFLVGCFSKFVGTTMPKFKRAIVINIQKLNYTTKF